MKSLDVVGKESTKRSSRNINSAPLVHLYALSFFRWVFSCLFVSSLGPVMYIYHPLGPIRCTWRE